MWNLGSTRIELTSQLSPEECARLDSKVDPEWSMIRESDVVGKVRLNSGIQQN
jgi:hypothetical protein